MAQYRPLRVCKCGKCECDLATAQEQDREAEKVHEFLFGLDDNYRTVRSTLVSRTPLQPLEEVYNIVRQEEDLKTTVRHSEEMPEVTAHAVQARPRMTVARSDTPDNSVLCKHCHRSGHSSDSCFAVIGYPEWWGERPRSRITQGRGRGGIVGAAPVGRGRNVNYANAVQVPAPPTNEIVNYTITDRDRDGVSGLNDAQWRALMNLLNGGANTSSEKLSGKSTIPSWIMDTGASHHITGNFSLLTDVRNMDPVLIILADGRERISIVQGTVLLGSHLILKSVFFVEGFHTDLISVGQLMDENNCVVQLADQFLVVQDRISRMVIGAGKRESGTFSFRRAELSASVRTCDDKSYELWHHRLGHPSAQVVGSLPHVSVSVSDVSNKACDVCFRAKQTRSSFPTSINKTTEAFQLIHSDLWGPYRTTSNCGARYFLTIVDDFSRCVWIYLLSDKTEAPIQLRNFFSMVERQFNRKVQTFRSDNGTEFTSLTNYFLQHGILHKTSCVGTPQQNGRAERKHRHILNVARALRFQSNLPIEFWGECILTAGYLMNRTPSAVLQGKTPFEMLYQKVPDYTHLRVFGSLCYSHNQAHKGDKFASRSRKCVFIGYPYGKKGWRLFDLEKQEFFVSRDVVFFENQFPFSDEPQNITTTISNEEGVLWAPISTGPFVEEENRPNNSLSPLVSPIETPIEENIMSTPSSPSPTPLHDNSAQLSPDSPPATDSSPSPSPTLTLIRRLHLPFLLLQRNYLVVDKDGKLNLSHCEIMFSVSHRAYLAAIVENVEPRSFKLAFSNIRWRHAMRVEVDALEENQTWTLEELPPGKRAIGSKWVYKIKYNSDGTINATKPD
ncbi:unnamed protein product [Microthlaspi erraticum]|uniref:Integrase catalytic domain-containing protein n=1 Tax=Microthlaspi erraticum TaxID=1685480 RepID=A0A6D2HS61_9BRAS|nr:unnamed protein product [Microthlaspi erraticum]